MSGNGVVEWKFVDDHEVPRGPWKSAGFRPGTVPGEPPLPSREPAPPSR